MKRHFALVPLSSHHQNALVLAKKLRATPDDASPEQRARLAREVLDFWNENGRDHFREEEDLVLPTWARFEAVWCPEVERMLREHIEIRALIDNFEIALSENHAPEWQTLRGLGETLDGHVRLEEHEIFDRVQKAVPEEELQRLKERLAGHQ